MRTADNVLSMRISEGAAGYGIYVMLLELLRDSETRSLVANPKNLAFAINESDVSLVERIVNDYGLFEVAPDGAFRSPWLEQQMQEYDSKKEAAREAGRRGAAKRYGHPVEKEQQPHSDPMGGAKGSLKAPDSNKTNTIISDKQNKPNPKLLDLKWDAYGGEDLLSIARLIQPPIDDITRQWAAGKQKELDEQRGRGKHNLDILVEICDNYKLGDAMFTFLLRYTDLGKVGSPELVKLIAIYHKNKADKFVPKYPAEYILVKLLTENNNDTQNCLQDKDQA